MLLIAQAVIASTEPAPHKEPQIRHCTKLDRHRTICSQILRFAATLKAGTPVIVEGKIKPETYTADGVEHKTFSIKVDYIRKIDYSAPTEASESKAAKPAKKAKCTIRAIWRRLFGAAFYLPTDRPSGTRSMPSPSSTSV